MNAAFLLVNRSASAQIIHAVLWLLLDSRRAGIHLLKAAAAAVTVTWQKLRAAGAQPSDPVRSNNRKWVKPKWQFLPAQQFFKQSFQRRGETDFILAALVRALLALRTQGRGTAGCLLAWLVAQGLQLEVNCLRGQREMFLPESGRGAEHSQRVQLQTSG